METRGGDGICERNKLRALEYTTQSSNKRGHHEAIIDTNQRDLIEDAEGKVHYKEVEVAIFVFQQKLAEFRVHEAEYSNIVDLAERAKQKLQFVDEELQEVEAEYGAAEAARREFDVYTAEMDVLGWKCPSRTVASCKDSSCKDL